MARTREQNGPGEEPGPGEPAARPDGQGAAGALRSVDRAVSVLEMLARHGEAGVTEIAGELGVHKSTASRLLGVLENRGLVTRTRSRGTYHLGAGVLRLAGAAAARTDVSQEGVPVCRDLADELGETVHLAVLDDDAAVNIMQVHGTAAVTARNWLGRRTPLHATAGGKVLLAHLPGPLLDGLLARPLHRFTDRTITGAPVLRDELRTVLGRGYATTLEELERGLAAVAAPVRSHEGTVTAAISVSGPVYRLTPDRLPRLGERMVSAAAGLSRRLGHGL